jgi:hypothetical protein
MSGRKWWRGRLWCPGCYGKHWLWRTVSRCDGQTFLEYAVMLAMLAAALAACLLFLKDRL